MSADVLRRAAALMRERAEAAPLETQWSRRSMDRRGTCDGCARDSQLVAAYADYSGENEPWLCSTCAADADFVSSWHPAVALAVADWLEQTALDWEKGPCDAVIPCNHCEHHPADISALELGRAYLGGAS